MIIKLVFNKLDTICVRGGRITYFVPDFKGGVITFVPGITEEGGYHFCPWDCHKSSNPRTYECSLRHNTVYVSAEFIALRADHGRGDPAAGRGAVRHGVAVRAGARQLPAHHRRLAGAPHGLPEPAADRAVRLPAHHPRRHPAPEGMYAATPLPATCSFVLRRFKGGDSPKKFPASGNFWFKFVHKTLQSKSCL